MIDFTAAKETLKELVELLVKREPGDTNPLFESRCSELYKQVEHALDVGELAHATLDRLVSRTFDPQLMVLKERCGQ